MTDQYYKAKYVLKSWEQARTLRHAQSVEHAAEQFLYLSDTDDDCTVVDVQDPEGNKWRMKVYKQVEITFFAEKPTPIE